MRSYPAGLSGEAYGTKTKCILQTLALRQFCLCAVQNVAHLMWQNVVSLCCGIDEYMVLTFARP